MENLEEKNNKQMRWIVKMLYIISCIFFAIPSIIYLVKNKTLLNFGIYFRFLFNGSSKLKQTLVYILILSVITILYMIILKNRKNIFKNNKQIYIYITIISLIFILVLPFTCSDIFYYLGIGRISTYHQNPYYVTIKDFVEQGNEQLLEKDTLLAQAYQNDWAGDTVVYGPIWSIICSIIAGLSFGSIDIGILIFKIVNIIVHIFNCYLIYKISNKKIFLLAYGLNPFVLIEGIACVHNDMFVIMFILLALYFLIKKKKIILSLLFVSLATTIKYFAILLLPFILIYNFRQEKTSKKLLKCIQFGLIFIVMLIVPYLLYIKDLNVLAGIFTQQTKIAKSFYTLVKVFFEDIPNINKILRNTFLGVFVIIYFWDCIILLNKKNITFRNMMRKYEKYLIVFLFVLITNFQPWYILWLFPCIIWLKADNMKLIVRNFLNK